MELPAVGQRVFLGAHRWLVRRVASANPLDSLTAALLSVVLFLVSQPGSRRAGWKPVVTILVSFVSGVLASATAALGIGINAPFVILSSIIFYIPGLALTVALTEISTGHLISGSSRLVDAVMLLLKLFFGAVSGVAVAHFLIPGDAAINSSLPLLSDWKTWPAVAGLSLGLGIAFNIPRRKMLWGLLSAAIAFASARAGEAYFGMYAGMFIGALIGGLFSNLYTRTTRGPGSILMTRHCSARSGQQDLHDSQPLGVRRKHPPRCHQRQSGADGLHRADCRLAVLQRPAADTEKSLTPGLYFPSKPQLDFPIRQSNHFFTWQPNS